MNVIKYNVNSGDVCQIGRQYEYGKTQVIFEGYQVTDSANEIYFKFVGRTEESKYLIPIVDMTLDITQQLTKHVGQFSCQLEEMNTEGTLVSQSHVFYVAVKRSIKVGADYEVQDPRLETIYQKYNEMYNIISQTNETSLANESQRQAEWLTLKQEVSDAINGIDGSLDTYKAETTQMLESNLAEYERQTTSNINTALKTYETQTDANLNEKFQTYSASTSSDINRMFDDSDRTSKEKIDGYISQIEQRRIAGEFNGSDGYTPVKDIDYFDGVDGKSAYQIAVDNGFIGTEAEWLASLRGADGKDGVQPDWNQNDDTQPDYVKNRPFYMGDLVETVLVEESTVSFAEHNGLYMAEFPSTFEATIGETYKVSWDGTVYECTCVTYNSRLFIGNLSIRGFGSDTGEPFIMMINNGKGIGIVTTDISASHTFSISGIAQEVAKIDEKYLPTIPTDKLPTIPTDKLPTIPTDKLPTIPTDKLPTIPTIEFTSRISDSIANNTQPSFAVSNLSYSEIYSIVEKGVFQIKDSGGACYSPIGCSIKSSGVIFVEILVIDSPMTYAQLACNANKTSFYRNAWWQIGATKK